MLRMVIASLMVLACATAHAQKMEPGQWEFTSTVTSPNAPKPQTITSKRCITKKDVTDPAHFQGKPQGDCKVTPKGKAGDAYAWEMSCAKSGMKGSGTTRYGNGTVEGETKLSGSSKDGKPYEMTTKMNGRRVGPCK